MFNEKSSAFIKIRFQAIHLLNNPWNILADMNGWMIVPLTPFHKLSDHKRK
jgi:hypothetical protein